MVKDKIICCECGGVIGFAEGFVNARVQCLDCARQWVAVYEYCNEVREGEFVDLVRNAEDINFDLKHVPGHSWRNFWHNLYMIATFGFEYDFNNKLDNSEHDDLLSDLVTE